MPISKDIELKLKAKLEAGEAISQAEQVGTQIANGIERSFEGLGEKLATKILAAFKNSFLNVNLMDPGQGNQSPGNVYHADQFGNVDTGSKTRGPILDPNGTPYSTQTPGVPPSSSSVAPEPVAASNLQKSFEQASSVVKSSSTDQVLSNEPPKEAVPSVPVAAIPAAVPVQQAVAAPTPDTTTQERIKKVAKASSETPLDRTLTGYASTLSPFSTIVNSLGRHAQGALGEFAMRDAAQTDDLVRRVKAGKDIKKIDKDFNTDELYTQDEVKERRQQIKAVAGASGMEFKRLSQALENLTKSVDKNSDRQKELEGRQEKLKPEEKEELDQIYSKLNQKNVVADKVEIEQGKLKRAGMAAAELDNATKPEVGKGPLLSANFMKGLAVAGTAATIAGELPGTIRTFKSDYAAMDNMTARAGMSGDVDRLMALQALGGQKDVQGQAGLEGGLKTVGSTLTGTATRAAEGAMAGGILGGLPGAVVGGLAGGAIGLYEGISGHSGRVRASMEDQVQKHLSENQEYYDLNKVGRNRAIGTFQQGQAMGSPELSRFLYGGEDASSLSDSANNKIVSASDNLKKTQERFDRYNENGPGGLQYGAYKSKLDAAKKDLAEAGNAETSEVASSRRMMIEDPLQGKKVPLRSYAVDHGLSNSSFEQMNQSLAMGMGGVFQGERFPRLEGETSNIGKLGAAKAQGFTNAAEVAGTLFQGGASRGDAMNIAYDKFENAVAAGLDKAKVGQSLQVMAQEASRGLGASTGAASNYDRALGAAQNMVGPGNKVEGRDMDYVQKVQSYNQDFARSKGGPGLVAGIMGVNEATKNLRKTGTNLNLNFLDKLELQQTAGRADQEGMQKFLERTQKRKFGLAETTKIMNEYNNSANVGTKKFNDSMGAAGKAQVIMSGVNSTMLEQENYQGVINSTAANKQATKQTNYNVVTESEKTKSLGAEESKKTELLNAEQIVKGVTTLGTTVGALNKALRDVIDRADMVLKQNPGASSTARPGGH